MTDSDSNYRETVAAVRSFTTQINAFLASKTKNTDEVKGMFLDALEPLMKLNGKQERAPNQGKDFKPPNININRRIRKNNIFDGVFPLAADADTLRRHISEWSQFENFVNMEMAIRDNGFWHSAQDLTIESAAEPVFEGENIHIGWIRFDDE